MNPSENKVRDQYGSEDLEALYAAAVTYLNEDGTPDSLEQSIDLLKRAAAGGHVPSISALGVLYDDMGNTVCAIPYLVKAANAGDQTALDTLASVYRRGDHIIREQIARKCNPNTYKAVSCFRKGDKHAGEWWGWRYFDRFNYYAPAFVGAVACGSVGFGLGLEYCPYYYIAPCLLAIIGCIVGFWAFRGAKMGKLWSNR